VTIVDYRILTAISCTVTACTGVYLLSRRAVIPAEAVEQPAIAA